MRAVLCLVLPAILGAQSMSDTTFLRGMIAHHAQALVMAEMIPARSTRYDLHLLGERITVSQRDEIALMRRWLAKRGADTTTQHGAHDHMAMMGAPMPGMLSDAELTALRGARSATFDSLFLRGMIKHHEGAVTMVKQLFATNGAGQNSRIFQLASEIESDQVAEIRRMQLILQSIK